MSASFGQSFKARSTKSLHPPWPVEKFRWVNHNSVVQTFDFSLLACIQNCLDLVPGVKFYFIRLSSPLGLESHPLFSFLFLK